MRKTLTILITFFTICLFIWMQINLLNAYPFFGTYANLGIILVIGIGLISGKLPGSLVGLCYGLLIDIIFSKTIGISIAAYVLLGLLAGTLSKGFSKENKLSILMMVFFMTVLFECCMYVVLTVLYQYDFEFWGMIWISLKEAIYNTIIATILYKGIVGLGELINKVKSSYYLL